MTTKTPITVAYGDGIGPEIMAATLRILEAAGANIAPEVIEVGEKVYLSGNTTGIPQAAWDSLARTRVLLKAPITTPQGGGYKSLNVTLRKSLGLYANVRPCRSLSPFVPTNHPDMDLVIVRENEEDLYAGIEHRQTDGAYQCLKIITREGCERIVKYAFEYARKFNRKKVTCMIKDNIMKMTDGLFHQVFKQIAPLYPEIQTDSIIIDIGTARLACKPELFDVIVTENLYGDIISDVAAEVVGSVGLAGSANVGDKVAMFEAIHGSAPDIAGKKIANPSGLLNGAIQMLIHIGQPDVAAKIENAWLKTLEDGIHTGDIYNEKLSKQKVGTDGFADAVIERLGQAPSNFEKAQYESKSCEPVQLPVAPMQEKRLVGVDVFINVNMCNPEALGEQVSSLVSTLHLKMISNRGVKVYPDGQAETHCSDHWCCRFQKDESFSTIAPHDVLSVMRELIDGGVDVIKSENLYFFDQDRGFTLAQGE
ncbi:MAG: isocitrate dehydrogenase [Gammaproteobacteria bacterium CG11_big_fil_rev_8_21_14_0_20_46_22]|nr:MAG: isocitrate dehydrogenase [Gammaproteobacteria bacterium CG12_big_fil_rev_8_21_14_0_65_46_12]PIR10406.1 MAG: isocitrate dehydrogenase [Gammaproteobacteria bacterium CG11_big_fil_rev_8_21_14_0_20_46_22]